MLYILANCLMDKLFWTNFYFEVDWADLDDFNAEKNVKLIERFMNEVYFNGINGMKSCNTKITHRFCIQSSTKHFWILLVIRALERKNYVKHGLIVDILIGM